MNKRWVGSVCAKLWLREIQWSALSTEWETIRQRPQIFSINLMTCDTYIDSIRWDVTMDPLITTIRDILIQIMDMFLENESIF
jgi:hypothetical protein